LNRNLGRSSLCYFNVIASRSHRLSTFYFSSSKRIKIQEVVSFRYHNHDQILARKEITPVIEKINFLSGKGGVRSGRSDTFSQGCGHTIDIHFRRGGTTGAACTAILSRILRAWRDRKRYSLVSVSDRAWPCGRCAYLWFFSCVWVPWQHRCHRTKFITSGERKINGEKERKIRSERKREKEWFSRYLRALFPLLSSYESRTLKSTRPIDRDRLTHLLQRFGLSFFFVSLSRSVSLCTSCASLVSSNISVSTPTQRVFYKVSGDPEVWFSCVPSGENFRNCVARKVNASY